MNKLPLKNDVLMVKYGFDFNTWYVHEKFGDFVLVGPRNWLVSDFLYWDIDELNRHKAVVVGRCIRIWPFRFFRYNNE